MARLIQKSGYINAGKATGYMEYVATRDGVEIIKSTEPVTRKQERFIKRLLKDFPDAKELFEYSDYLQTPNQGKASAFIAVALDTHLHEVESESGYMSYIAQRPRAEKHGGHGLFSEVDTTDLKAAKAELKAHGGKVWTFIFSLRREDAERLGYGYHVSVVDLRNPTRSDGYNLMTLINRYMDTSFHEHSIEAYGKAENLASILAHSIIAPKGDEDRGQNDYFYKAAEGVVASVILLLAEFLSPDSKHPTERRHLVSVFILIQQLLAPSGVRGKTYFKQLMDMLPPHHRARNLASSALESSDQATASAMSTALAQMNTFMDIALEQVICFDSNIDAEKFAKEKTAIFLVLPEEDRTKNFMAGLMIQNLSKELFELAEKGKGRLPNRVVFFCDEFGTMPAFDVEALFSAGRSRGITLVPIIQSLAQLEKNYGREGAEILTDNCQDTIFGGFAPNSQTAEQLSKSLGSRTVLSGSISKGKNDPSQSLQMIERPLMTPDELKSLPKGTFVVMKTGTHPMQTKLRLFFDWGITFGEPYTTPEHAARPVAYASRQELFLSISKRYSGSSDQPVQAQQASTTQRRAPRSAMGLYSEDVKP